MQIFILILGLVWCMDKEQWIVINAQIYINIVLLNEELQRVWGTPCVKKVHEIRYVAPQHGDATESANGIIFWRKSTPRNFIFDNADASIGMTEGGAPQKASESRI